MAGRPRAMAERVTELCRRTLVLRGDFCKIMPAQYRRYARGADPLGLRSAWTGADRALYDACWTVMNLADRLRKRVGMPSVCSDPADEEDNELDDHEDCLNDEEEDEDEDTPTEATLDSPSEPSLPDDGQEPPTGGEESHDAKGPAGDRSTAKEDPC